jgi:hypothetical protein
MNEGCKERLRDYQRDRETEEKKERNRLVDDINPKAYILFDTF